MRAKGVTDAMLRPRHPERVCWGCDQYCPADTLGCANGSIRTPHPSELFGDDWLEWERRGRDDEPAATGTVSDEPQADAARDDSSTSMTSEAV